MSALPDPETLLEALAGQLAPALPAEVKLIGIHSGGAWLAERLAEVLPGRPEHGSIDVSFYRDDFSRVGLHAQIKKTHLPFDIEGADLLLIDDVLFTGRSVRAALHEIFDYGRPHSVQLAVLIDRGGRELPIEAQFVGARLAVPRDQSIVLGRDASGRLALALEPRQERADA
ncbi:pyrimidine operon attenuation protein / uracil phosphoribosyltransferase [Burkholderiales bacterium]|nr:MAG: bifunctional pyr operon transcriptional regulator/uracil phosphoribosyltransferase PyrR [Burkholderiales bacterium]CAG0994134.1 pyrimidine operon attenuation protein / uracil phosphoribosyltransferase [Burkholderiales bacterium]